MNNLSWMIYLAGVADQASGVFEALSVFFGIFGLIGLCFFAAFISIEFQRFWTAAVIVSFALILEGVFVTGSILIPSSSTIYMIAASEAGETVVTSPDGKEMLGDLKEIIRRKLKEQLKEEVGI